MDVFGTIGWFLTTALSLLYLFEKIPFLKEIFSKKPEINIDSFYYSSGLRFRSEKEKDLLKGSSFNFPRWVATFDIELRLINTSKFKNVIDLEFYVKKSNGTRLNLGRMRSIALKPMIPFEITTGEMVFNWTNEKHLWDGVNWEGMDDKKIANIPLQLDSLCIEVIDVHRKKKTLKLPLQFK